jgi:hypothetical protein
MSRARMLAVSALLVAAVPATARAQSFWDLVSLQNPGATCCTYNASATNYTIFNGAESVFLFQGDPTITNNQVSLKWHSDNVAPLDEKGVGLCRLNAQRVCEGDEIGDQETGWLAIDLFGLGTNVVTSVTLASLSDGEAFWFAYCTDGAATTCDAPQLGTSFAGVLTLTAPQTQRYLVFKNGTGGPIGNNYLVQGFTTTVPEPGTMGLLALGLVGLSGAGLVRRRRKESK